MGSHLKDEKAIWLCKIVNTARRKNIIQIVLLLLLLLNYTNYSTYTNYKIPD